MHENKYPIVNHPRDPRFLTLRSLQLPQGRSRTGHYIIEGIRHIARAVERNAPIESVFLDPSVLSNPFGQKLARRLRKRGVVGVRLSYQLYRDLTLASEPQGIGAVVRQQWIPLANVGVGRDSFWLAVESIESPGNLGTIIRTAEAAGISGIFVLDSESDPFDPAAVRASMGSLFSQKLTRCTPCEFADWASPAELRSWVRRQPDCWTIRLYVADGLRCSRSEAKSAACPVIWLRRWISWSASGCAAVATQSMFQWRRASFSSNCAANVAAASVVRHADGQLSLALFPRLNFSRISFAFAVRG